MAGRPVPLREVAFRIMAARINQGLALETVAKAASILPPDLRQIEHGNRRPSRYQIEKLSPVLDRPVAWLNGTIVTWPDGDANFGMAPPECALPEIYHTSDEPFLVAARRKNWAALSNEVPKIAHPSTKAPSTWSGGYRIRLFQTCTECGKPHSSILGLCRICEWTRG